MPSARLNNARLPRLLSTASLRLALTFSLIFGVGAALLVAGIDYGLFRFAEAETREDLTHQMNIMEGDAARLGGGGLIAMLEAQSRNHEARRYLFLVITTDGQTFSNGLARNAVNDEGFRHNLPNKPRPPRWPDQTPDLLVLSHTMPDGTLLAIGRDAKHLDELRGGIRTFALWSGLGVIALAMLAGLALGYQFLRRLGGMNRSVDRIISGNTSERLPAVGLGREFDELAANLNRMLDRQEATMEALKSVSEGIAHDLRTPLGRLRNRLEELEADAGDPARRQTGIDLAMQEIGQITALFDSLLALSRLESGQNPQGAPIDARGLIERVGEIYGPTVEDAGGTLRMHAPDAALPITVRGDEHLLMQALSNLVENAIVHGGDGPEITLDARQEGNYAVFVVADRGPGVPPDEREKVLRRFYRMDSSRSRPGSGLGLAMCAAVANRHGGTLTLSDNEPGLKVELKIPTTHAD
ncbi:MAG TPA: HAMP domain-containing sensor histidine kinase [Croceibacterium sp.]|nr:HAMP domain-containing sensor histidine kinase [Croceibacterium sp.]